MCVCARDFWVCHSVMCLIHLRNPSNEKLCSFLSIIYTRSTQSEFAEVHHCGIIGIEPDIKDGNILRPLI